MQAPVWLWTAQQMVIHLQLSAGEKYPITVLSSFLWPILDYSMKEPTDAPLITVLEMLLQTCPLLFTVSTLLDAVYLSWSIYFSRNNPMGSLGNRMEGELFSLISPSCLGSRYGRAVFREVETQQLFKVVFCNHRQLRVRVSCSRECWGWTECYLIAFLLI